MDSRPNSNFGARDQGSNSSFRSVNSRCGKFSWNTLLESSMPLCQCSEEHCSFEEHCSSVGNVPNI